MLTAGTKEGDPFEQVLNLPLSGHNLRAFAATQEVWNPSQSTLVHSSNRTPHQASTLVTQILGCWSESQIRSVLRNVGYNVFPHSGIERQANQGAHQVDMGSQLAANSTRASEELEMSSQVDRATSRNEQSHRPTMDARERDAGLAANALNTLEDPLERELRLSTTISEHPQPAMEYGTPAIDDTTDSGSQVLVTSPNQNDSDADLQGEEEEEGSVNSMSNTSERNIRSAGDKDHPSGSTQPTRVAGQEREGMHKRTAETDLDIERWRKRQEVGNTGQDVSSGDDNQGTESPLSQEEESEVPPGLLEYRLPCEVTNCGGVRDLAFKGRNRRSNDRKKVEDLYYFFTSLEQIAHALHLLASICSADKTVSQSSSVTMPETDASMAQPPTDPLTLAKGAGVWAYRTLENATRDRGRLALAEIMAMLTLHLVHKKVLEPMWKECSPRTPDDSGADTVWKFGYNILGGEETLGTKSSRTFQERVRNGGSLLKLVQSVGAPALLVIAVSGRGITAFARELGTYTHVNQDLTAVLSTSPVWWGFTHAIGHLTVARLFTSTWPSITSGQLAYWMRTQPLPTRTLKQWDTVCLETDLKLEYSLPPDLIRLLPNVNHPKVTVTWLNHELNISPMIDHLVTTKPSSTEKDLSSWLFCLDEMDVVKVDSGEWLKLCIVKDLAPGNDIRSATLDFFSAVHNSRSLEGHIVLDSAGGEILLHQATHHTGLDKLREAMQERVGENECSEILAAIGLEGGVVGFQISIEDRLATLHNWISGEEGLAVGLEAHKVSFTLMGPFLFRKALRSHSNYVPVSLRMPPSHRMANTLRRYPEQ